MESKKIDSIRDIMESHFLDDKKAFEKFSELLILNGDHMSTFRRDITSIMDTLQKQNEVYEQTHKILTDHIARVEPMISSYEKDSAFSKMLGEKGKKWGSYVLGMASLVGAFYVIREFIIKLLR